VLAEERCATSAEAELKAVKEKKNAADTAKIRGRRTTRGQRTC